MQYEHILQSSSICWRKRCKSSMNIQKYPNFLRNNIKPPHLSLEPASQDDDDEDVYAGEK